MSEMFESFHHDRFFISHLDGVTWKVGDRELSSSPIFAVCQKRADAVRVWRAMIAFHDKHDPVSLADMENEDLRAALAQAEQACKELESEANVQAELVASLMIALHPLRDVLSRFPPPPRAEPAPAKKPRKSRRAKPCPYPGCTQTDGKPCAFAQCPNRGAKP